ncbi:MAG: hypothetical protein A3D16_16865 [Rhodobacterales bacterium RIFCSPHIGHO2_02_FULL_62_130]|nr:MAG: hypothetical protein A3D16_16865 [Rhodobacterales bacterium RIFCSPHIGHO2_02_FULL_62_130]OHC60563.1 MAG: hypothetical protein A3E48_13495 [Rhodobacterales bacterium RIFCSPHIGHO2_12_FULL_62_75]
MGVSHPHAAKAAPPVGYLGREDDNFNQIVGVWVAAAEGLSCSDCTGFRARACLVGYRGEAGGAPATGG